MLWVPSVLPTLCACLHFPSPLPSPPLLLQVAEQLGLAPIPSAALRLVAAKLATMRCNGTFVSVESGIAASSIRVVGTSLASSLVPVRPLRDPAASAIAGCNFAGFLARC